MKQLLVISGKGGTGKTSIVASFAHMSENSVFVDADVDAANLHLILSGKRIETVDFVSGQEAHKNDDLCDSCGICKDACTFDAIDDDFNISLISCEGCGLCARVCPTNALKMEESLSGQWFVTETKQGTFVHAKLGIAAENSGKLVALIRAKAKEIAEKQGADLVLIDGPPGIGCPVISSMTGCDLVLVITEPSVSGKHDLERVLSLAKHFNIPALVAVNKSDLDLQMTKDIETISEQMGAKPVGRIPFSREFVDSMVTGKSLVEYSKGEAAQSLRQLWETVKQELDSDEPA